MDKKNISFKVENDFHKKIKIKAATEDKTIKDYLLGLADKDLNKGGEAQQMDKEYLEQIKKYEDIKRRAIEGLEKARQEEGIQQYNLELWENLIAECDKSIENVKELDKMWKQYK